MTLLIIFMSKGMGFASSYFDLNNASIANVLVAFMYFIIIACEFFILYKVTINKRKKATKTGFLSDKVAETSNQEKEDK